jgi:hypothetical protein
MELQMNAHELEVLSLAEGSLNTVSSTPNDEEYSIPLDISDIINICREFNKLGGQMQNQVENILEVGVQESIKSGIVKQQSLPYIKSFLRAIERNAYFGDAVSQAHDCVELIVEFEEKNKVADKTSLAN